MLADFGISAWIKTDPLSSKEVVAKQEAAAGKKKSRKGLSDDATAARQTLVGTPCWMAPEVMLSGLGTKEKDGGQKGYNQAADIWSLGKYTNS